MGNHAFVILPKDLTKKTIDQTINELKAEIESKKGFKLNIQDIFTHLSRDPAMIIEAIKTGNKVNVRFYREDMLLSTSHIQIDGDIEFNLTSNGFTHWREELNMVHTLALENIMANYHDTMTLGARVLKTVSRWSNRVNLATVLLNVVAIISTGGRITRVILPAISIIVLLAVNLASRRILKRKW